MGTTKTTFGPRTKLPTSMADLGCVMRWDSDNFNTIHPSFVLDEALQLVETPVTNPIVHFLSSIPFSNPFEVFHHYFITFKVGHNVLTDVMIHPSHITSFTPTQLLEKPLTGACAFGLQFTTQVFEFPFDLLDLCRLIEPAVRTDSKVIYSEVNAQNNVLRTTVLLSGIELFRECEYKEAPAFLINPKQALLDIPTEIPFIAFRDTELELLPTFEQSQYKNIPLDVSTSWEIVSNICSFDYRFGFRFLDYLASLLNTSDSKLGWEFESFPNSMINSIMEFKILSDFMLPSIVHTELQGFSVSLGSTNYLFSSIDSDFRSHSCSHNNYKSSGVYKPFGGENQNEKQTINLGTNAVAGINSNRVGRRFRDSQQHERPAVSCRHGRQRQLHGHNP